MPGEPAATGPPFRWSGYRSLLIDVAWLALLLGWCAQWCLTAAERLGPTFDEPIYMQAGLESWRTGVPERAATHGVMPLPLHVLSYPLHRHEKQTGEKIDDMNTEKLLKHLGAARRMTLLWVGLLLVAALRLGRAAGGPWAGRVAAGLLATDPSFLAHSTLATTDVAVAAALLAFTWAVYVGRSGGWWWRILLPGLLYGVAVLCKLSALLFGGIILVALEVAYRFSSGGLSRPEGAGFLGWAVRVVGAVTRSVVAAAAVIGIGIALAIYVYGNPPPGTKPLALLLPKIPKKDPLRPDYIKLAQEYEGQPYAVVAFAFQVWHNSVPRPTFLNGSYYPKGRWDYFPILLGMKVPLAVLVLGIAALARPRALLNPLSIAALLLLAVTLKATVQTGIRLVFPVVAVGYVAVAVAVCRGFGRSGSAAGLLAVLAMAIHSVAVWPHGLGYLNELAGGPSAAYWRVSDSNLDWGQGVPDLMAWHKAHGEPPMAVWYFGPDPVAAKPPFEQLFIEFSPVTTEEEFRAVVGRRLLAVGTTVITMHPFDPPQKAASMRFLLRQRPVARTATFAIYDFRNLPFAGGG